ncbi:MAG: hypothetical protein JWL79_2952 [Frankiales bacterium]|nr:hypothetical protein [Frankiales bacterium]
MAAPEREDAAHPAVAVALAICVSGAAGGERTSRRRDVRAQHATGSGPPVDGHRLAAIYRDQRRLDKTVPSRKRLSLLTSYGTLLIVLAVLYDQMPKPVWWVAAGVYALGYVVIGVSYMRLSKRDKGAAPG